MIRPAVAACCTALGVSVISNLVIVTFYDLAFDGFWDRLLFVLGLSALAALMTGLVVDLAERLCRRWPIDSLRCQSRLRSISIATIVVVAVGLWVDSFLGGWVRILGIAALLLLTVLGLAVGGRVGSRQGSYKKIATLRLWVCLGGIVLVSGIIAGAVQPGAHRVSTEASGSVEPSRGQRLPPDTNLVLLVVETLRGDHLGFEGYPRNTSPTIDRLAEQGVAFRGATAQATRTSPSMASLMTSMTPLTHGIIESRSVLGAEFPTLGKILQEAGYRNAAIVANPMVGSSFGYEGGFQVFDEMYRESSDQIDAAAVVDRAISWLELPPGEPFALWLHFLDPHAPYKPPDPWRDEFFGDALYESQPSAELRIGGRIGAMPPSATVEGHRSLRDYVALYDAEIRYTDSEIGRLLSYLEGCGLDQSTLVILTSDHGESLGDHNYYFSHGAYSYDSTSRVPLVFYHPLLESPGELIETPRLIDLVPSVVELLGLSQNPQFEGVSLFSGSDRGVGDAVAPILSGTLDYTNLAVRTRDAKLILVPRHWRGFDHLARWKLGMWPNLARHYPMLRRSFRRELYDLAADPRERVNLAGQLPEKENRLLDALLDWVRSSAASIPAAERRSREDLDREVDRQLEALGYLD